jgi:hypothetical protein
MFYGDIHSVSCGVRSHSLEHNKLDKAQDTVSRKWGGGGGFDGFFREKI